MPLELLTIMLHLILQFAICAIQIKPCEEDAGVIVLALVLVIVVVLVIVAAIVIAALLALVIILLRLHHQNKI